MLFTIGSLFAYFTLDRGLNFLLGFGGDQITTFLQADRYINYVIFVLLAFGVSFQFPLLLVFLELVGVVDDIKLRRWRRGMIFGIAVFTALITPSQDPFTFAAMALPMCVLLRGRRRLRPHPRTEAAPPSAGERPLPTGRTTRSPRSTSDDR